MGMSLADIKARLKGLEEGKPKSKKWKPKDKHNVRCLPIPGEEDLSLIVKWHYGVDGGRQMYCPTTHGDQCDFCDFAATLKGWKDENGKDKSEGARKMDWELFKKLDAAVKHYIPIVVRKPDSTDLEGPFLWELTPKTYTSVFAVCANDERNDDHPDGGGLRILTSLEHGVDLEVELKKKGEKGNTTTFDLTFVTPGVKMRPVVKGDKAATKALLEKIPDISEIGKPISSQEAEKVFATWKASMNDAPADTSGGVEHGGGPKANSGEVASRGGKSVDETVAALEALLEQ